MSILDVGLGNKPTTPNETAEKIMEYEKHYHDIVKNYLPEIEAINKLLQNLRDEENAFWDKFPEIEKAMKNDDVLSKEIKQEWLKEYRNSMTESFAMSKKLIEHYIISNVEEFKRKLENAMNKV